MRFLVVSIAAVAVLAAGTLLVPAQAERAHTSARLSDFPTFLFATIADGHLRGNVAVVQRTSRPSADIFVSLHGLDSGKAYHLDVTAAGCGGGGANPKALLSVPAGKTGADEDDFFEAGHGRLTARLARGKAVRVSTGGKQIACARANRVR